MATLQLYLRNSIFQEMEFDLPEHRDLIDDPAQNFEMNCQLREEFISQKVSEMRALYIRQIIKSQHEYNFVLVVSSKIGEPNLIEDSII